MGLLELGRWDVAEAMLALHAKPLSRNRGSLFIRYLFVTPAPHSAKYREVGPADPEPNDCYKYRNTEIGCLRRVTEGNRKGNKP